jgi:prepilin-type N-terminal cleavage/methylation domain-containing protein
MRDIHSRTRRRTSTAFTLIELLVCIAIMGVVLSFAIPPLLSLKAHTRQQRCLANMRGTGLLLLGYSDMNRDHLPFGPHETQTLSHEDMPDSEWGGEHGLWWGRWSYLFPDEWAAKHWNAAYRCPKQPRYDPTLIAWSNWTKGGRATPAYDLSMAVWLDGSTMTAESAVDDWKLKPNCLSDVVFPSQKVYAYEFPGFCATGSEAEFFIAIGQTPLHKVSMSLFDGSCRRLALQDGLPGAGGAMPILGTADGIRGRDIP